MKAVTSFPITIDRERRLLFDDAALRRAQTEFHLDIGNLVRHKQSLKHLRILIFCGLAYEADPLSFDRVKQLVKPEHAGDFSPMWIAVGKALLAGRGLLTFEEGQDG